MDEDQSNDDFQKLQELLSEYDEKSVVKQKKECENVEEELARLEKSIFGNKETFKENITKSVLQVSKYDDDHDSTIESNKRKPVWTDDNDEEAHVKDIKKFKFKKIDASVKNKSYKEYIRSQFIRVAGQPKWASLENKNNETENESDELLRKVGFLAKASRSKGLQEHIIQIKRLKDLNRETYAEGVIRSIQFHPTSTAALVSGESFIASIYSVDGYKNEKLHSMRFKNFPIKCAKIDGSGAKAYFGSIRNYYYSYDLIEAKECKLRLPSIIPSLHRFQLSPCGRYIAAVGKYGAVHLLTANTNELIHSFKQESTPMDLCFTSDSARLICNGNDSTVSIFSIRQQQLEHNFIDDGCIRGKSLHLAPNQRLLATGSMEGVVNVYDFNETFESTYPEPRKILMNLTCAITSLRFNHSSELLAMSSSEVPNSIKLVHFPSATVFANFPVRETNVGEINTVEFSPASGYMALGTRKSKVPLFKLKYFKKY